MQNDFRTRMQTGESLFGTMITLPCPSVSELLALTGYDWLFIDGEHGAIEATDLRNIVAAVASRAACLVRVPSHDEVSIKRALDLGATGIIVPQVNSAEQAAAIVDHCRYPTTGSRGIGLARAHGYGVNFQDYLDNANERVTVVVQAEHRKAVENIEAIASVPGIDCVLIGPNDLAASYGKTGKLNDPVVVDAMKHVCTVCRAKKLSTGIFGIDAESVQPWMELGCNLVVAGIDTVLLGSAARKLLDELKS